MTRPISLIPFVCGAGGSTPGAEHGALYAYDHHLAENLTSAGIKAEWAANPHDDWLCPEGEYAHQNLAPRGDPQRHVIVKKHTTLLAKRVASAIKSGHIAVTIGGDHSMGAGSVAGVQMALGTSAPLGLIWVDAHTDLHTFSSSSSKALHGMPVGTLLNLDDAIRVEDTTYPVMKPENIIYAGLRDVDDGEVVHALKIGLDIPSLKELRATGVAQVLQTKINKLKSRCNNICLSIDLDAFAADLAPAVGTMVPDGFLYEEIMPLLCDLVATHSVPLIEVVELNPTLPGAKQTYDLLTRILSDLLQYSR